MIPRVHWSVEGQGVFVEDDWRASTVANGGYNAFSGRVKESVARRFDFDQGVRIRGYLDSGKPIWEGRTITPPTFDNGYAFLTANGHKTILEKNHKRLLFQSRDIQATDEASSPFNGSPASSISVNSGHGFIQWEVSQGQTVATNDAHAQVLWVPDSHIRLVDGTLTVQGTATNYELRAYRFTGPTGTRTSVAAPSLVSGAWTLPVTSPENAVALSLRYLGGGETRASTLRVTLTDPKIYDNTVSGQMEAGDVAAFVGRRVGFDVSGVMSGGPAIDPATAPGGVIITAPGESGISFPEPGIATSGLDVLPLDWNGGSWAALLDYIFSTLLDWRWRVLADLGSGPLLQAGPWANAWEVTRASNASTSLTSQELFNEVIVRYTNTAGKPIELSATADPDPFVALGIPPNQIEEALSDTQADTTLAALVATTLLKRAGVRRQSGRMDITGARDVSGKGSCYEVIAGDMVTLTDAGQNESLTARITETEMTVHGTSLGVEDHVSAASQIAAMVQQRRLRRPFGVVSRV